MGITVSIRAIRHQQAIGVERCEFLVHRRHVTVVPVFELVGFGVAGQLAQEVLIAGRFTWIQIAVVEACALERQVAALRIDLTLRDLRAERIDQPAGANDQRIAVKAVLTV